MDRFEAYDLAHEIKGAALGQMPNIPTRRCSMRESCEEISQFFAAHGVRKTPEEIFNYSPSGELYMVFDWLRQALSWQQRCRAVTDQRGKHA